MWFLKIFYSSSKVGTRGSMNQRRMVSLILEFQAMAPGEGATRPCMGWSLRYPQLLAK